jgi:hypothetical protein
MIYPEQNAIHQEIVGFNHQKMSKKWDSTKHSIRISHFLMKIDSWFVVAKLVWNVQSR